jgi:23S rRNA pseudouridine1911/1915/1917 synthase
MTAQVVEVALVMTGRLDAALAASFPDLSRAKLGKLIERGMVRIGGAPALRGAAWFDEGTVVELTLPEPEPMHAAPQDLPLRVVHTDDAFVVVDKEPGMVVHPGAGNPDGTLVNALLHHLGELSAVGGAERPGIVHRLDKGTSGLLVVARSDAAHAHLAAQFAAHTAGRRYLALVWGGPEALTGRIETWLGRHPIDRVRFASVDEADGKRAVTRWRVRGRGRGLTLLELRLETGRTHQIRVHTSEQGWPVVNDPLYSGRRTAPAWLEPFLPTDRPLLHAWQLRFRHPTNGSDQRFIAPIPADFAAVMAEAGIGEPAAQLAAEP